MSKPRKITTTTTTTRVVKSPPSPILEGTPPLTTSGESSSSELYLTPEASPPTNLTRPKYVERPCFLTSSGKPIRAGGVLAFCRNPANKQVYFLMGNYRKNRWEDLGGKTSLEDQDWRDTLVREATEETNAAFHEETEDVQQPVEDRVELLTQMEASRQFWHQQLMDSSKSRPFYIHHSKYRLVVIELNSSWLQRRPKEFFGEREIWEDESRTIDWILAPQLVNYMKQKKRVNPRLFHAPLRYLIQLLAENWQTSLFASMSPTTSPTTPPTTFLPVKGKTSQNEEDQLVSSLQQLKIG